MYILLRKVFIQLLLSFSLIAVIKPELNFIDRERLAIMLKNRTSCEEFVRRSKFDAKSVVDKEWSIFYFWTPGYEEPYHAEFRFPPRKLLEWYRKEMRHLKSTVIWENALIFMETSIGYRGLFVQTKTPGIFQLILTESALDPSIPVFEFALKTVDGYLGMMNCHRRLCYAFGPVGHLPAPDKLTVAASRIGCTNEFGRSYLTRPTTVDDEDIAANRVDHDLELIKEIKEATAATARNLSLI